MNTLIVEILPTDINYIPPSNLVKHGDTVTFRLGAGVVSATVTFDKTSCLDAPGPFHLNDSTLAASESSNEVSFTASGGFYPFSVDIDATPSQSRIRGDHEVKRGGLDVSTDPPEG